MTEVKFQESQQIITQGESGSEYYIIKRGQCQVTVNNSDGQQTKLKILKEGEAFGEVALLYDAVRTATVTALTEGSLWKLDGHIFKKIIIESTQQRRSTELGFLENVEIFKNLDKYEKLKLLDGIKSLWFHKGEAIIRAGQRGEVFYIVE